MIVCLVDAQNGLECANYLPISADHCKLNFAFLSFEMLIWKLGTSKELDLEQKRTWQKRGNAPKSDFAGCDPAIKPLT